MRTHRPAELTSSRPQRDREPSPRQDRGAQRFIEKVGPDDPVFGPALAEIAHLKDLGINVTAEIVDRVIELLREQRRPVPVDVPAPDPNRVPMQRKPNARFAEFDDLGEVVYYIRIGNRVKIGTSTNLRQRLADLNPEEVMALERGGRTVEMRRHRQFASLRTHGEWFRLEGELAQFIESLGELGDGRQEG